VLKTSSKSIAIFAGVMLGVVVLFTVIYFRYRPTLESFEIQW
jgi:hypothetical protein